METSQHTSGAIPVETYLRGCVGYTVADGALTAILFKRMVAPGTDVNAIPKKIIDLCTADLYMWCSTLPSVSSTVEDSDAGWKHKEGGSQKNNADASRLVNMANSIYETYGENTTKSSFRMRPLGMRVWK